MSKISDTLKAGCGFECSRTETTSGGKTIIHTWPPQCPDSSGRINVTEPFAKEFTTKTIVSGAPRFETVYVGDPPETLGGDSITVEEIMRRREKARPARAEGKDMVRHPDHYDEGDPVYEPIKVIQAWNLDFAIGNAVKYLARYKKKWNPIEDLEMAKQYIDFEIEALKREDADGGIQTDAP